MKKRHSIFMAIVLVLVLVFSTWTIASAAADEPNPWASFDTSQEVNLVLYAVGTKGPDHERVIALVNERMKELINTTIDVEIIPLSDFQTRYPLVLAGGDDVDMIITHPRIGPFSTNADNGAFLALSDDFLNKWMPETMKSQAPMSWRQSMYKGNLYYVPRNQSDYEQAYGVVVIKELREKYGIPEITNVDEFEQYLFAIAKGEQGTGLFAFYANPTLPISWVFLNSVNNWLGFGSVSWDADNPGRINPDDIFIPALTPEYREYCLRMANWAKEGVWPSNAITNVTHTGDLFKEGKSASDICNYKAANADIVEMEKQGKTAEYFCLMPDTANTRISPYGNDGLAITYFSKHPERAALAIDVMKNDPVINNLLQGGIEGEHYILNADNTHSNGPNYEGYPWGGWAWCLRSQLNPTEGGLYPAVKAMRQKYDSMNIDPDRFTIDGFTFDNTGLEAESALINSLNQEWSASFDLGVFGDETDAKLDEYVALLKEAGIEKILQATKDQLAQFLADNY